MFDRPTLILKLEEASLLTASILIYRHFHFSWLLFAALFLAPDLSMLGYLVDTRVGAALYNLAHTLTVPIALFAAGWFRHSPAALAVAIIWIAHIAFDRMLGYGLKYPTSFKDTHLQHVP